MSYVQELTERNEEDSFWSRQKNSCNHGDLLLPRAIWRVFGDPGHAPHTGSNALHLYRGWARADSGFWYGGDTVQTEVKTEARDRDPNVLQLPEPTSLNPAEQPPCMLAPLVRSGVTYRIYTGNVYSELRKAGCCDSVHLHIWILARYRARHWYWDSFETQYLPLNSINLGPHLNPMPHTTWHISAVTSSGILKAKQKLGITFNLDRQDNNDFTKFKKMTMCRASEANSEK